MLWDMSTGKLIELIARLLGHTAKVDALAFSADGKLLVTGSGDNTARVWEPATGRAIGTLMGHTDAVTSVAFSPDGRFVLTGSNDRNVIAWDTANAFHPSKKLSNHAAGVEAISIGPGGRAYVIDFAGNAYIWDWPKERIIVASASGSDRFGFASFGLGGTYAAIADKDGMVGLWDSEAARTVMRLRSGKEAQVSALLWSGQHLIVGDQSGALAIYDLREVTVEQLAERACAKERSLAPRFTWMESATDPLIREVWDPQGTNRSVCE
jgi:WD40 repeat protein